MSDRAIWLATLAAAASVGCGAAVPAQEEAPSTSEESAAPAGLPVFLGFRMTDSPDAIVRSAPALSPAESSEASATILEGVHLADGVSLRVRLAFKDGQLATVSAEATPCTLAEFDAVSRAIRETLGPGDPMECGSDEGVTFEDYLASARGSRRVHWRSETMFASVRVSPMSDGRLQLSAHASWLPFQEPVDFEASARPDSRHFAKEDSTCEEANTNEEAYFLGVPFGASIAQARGALGGEVDHHGLGVSTEIAGVAGRAHLRFYDDCLASAVFLANDPNTANYRSLVQELQGSTSGMRLERCSPNGGPPDESMLADGRGFLHAQWEGTASGRVRLGQTTDKELVVEMEYGPLRGRAPQIDFSE